LEAKKNGFEEEEKEEEEKEELQPPSGKWREAKRVGKMLGKPQEHETITVYIDCSVNDINIPHSALQRPSLPANPSSLIIPPVT
jgi:hypothetical protein